MTADLAKLSSDMVSSNMTAPVSVSIALFVGLVAAIGLPGTASAQRGTGRVATPRPQAPAQGSAASGTGSNSSPGKASPQAPQTDGRADAPALSGTLNFETHRPPTTPRLTTGIPLGSAAPGARFRSRPLGIGVYVPLGVADAPAYGRGGSTQAVATVSPDVVSVPAFYPTMEPPVWRVIAEERPVQAWRVIEVTDVVCDATGRCNPVTTRMLARWAPQLSAYAFRDRVGRVWRVE